MSGRWRNAKALNASNVVCLPTAAPRQIKQPCNKGGRAARQALREEQPWPGEYIEPRRRRALRHADKLAALKPTPALAIAAALVAVLDEKTRLRVIGKVAASGSPAAAEALAFLQTEELTVGEQLDLSWALERLRSGGGEA